MDVASKQIYRYMIDLQYGPTKKIMEDRNPSDDDDVKREMPIGIG